MYREHLECAMDAESSFMLISWLELCQKGQSRGKMKTPEEQNNNDSKHLIY